ncbi:patatin family protein [Vibrio hannami]|uniref:patatin-like phospholipase family protein n=1 Tax=Vibrio hannami TaxID=2717094 RepID=UPI00241097F8|nr:patatin family protein [Vibrio hannami]MDG3086259.1 patatin family protein [Vibrio hannami]
MEKEVLVNTESKHALVVEGGAMRGIFAAGVLDRFIDEKYRPFDFCIGVSAGSTNLAAWLANQRGRTKEVITNYSCRPEFINFVRFAKGGHWLELDWLWDVLSEEYPLDLDAFESQPIPLYIATTLVRTGEACYITGTSENLELVLKASCSVPMAYRDYPVYEGEPMTDGGVADSIPVIKAYEMGAREITVVLSQIPGYRKSAPKAPWMIRRLLKRTPRLADAMIRRAVSYNKAIDFIENPPQDCKINVIAPDTSFSVGRLTTDQEKLIAGYDMGFKVGSVR